MTKHLGLSVVLLVWSISVTSGQLSQWNTWQDNANNENNINQRPSDAAGNLLFFMDKSADCNGPIRQVKGSSMIYGHGGIQQDQGPLECVLRLNIDSPRDPKRFRLRFEGAQVREEDVQFFIHDGEGTSGRLLATIVYNQDPGPNFQDIYSSGGWVTFRLSRKFERNFNYDIRIQVIPVSVIIGGHDECSSGSTYGCTDYSWNFWNPLGKKEIFIGVVAAAFALVVLIIVIIILVCYRKHKNENKRFEENKHGTLNTAASLHSSNGTIGDQSKHMWASEASGSIYPKYPQGGQKSRLARESEDADDVFETVDMPYKRPPLAPPSYREANRSNNRNGGFSRTAKQNGHMKTIPSERRYRDEETSLNSDEDDQPPSPSTFIERVIEPRVKTKEAKQWTAPPTDPVDDWTYDTLDIDKVSIEPETEEHGIQCEGEESSEEERESEEEEEGGESSEEEDSEEESGSESEAEDQTDKVDPKTLYAQPQKRTGTMGNPQPYGPEPPRMAPGAQMPAGYPPGVHPLYGYPMPRPQPMGPAPYLQQQPQRAPFHPGSNQFRPVPYQQPPPGFRQPSFPQPQPVLNPNDPPVYSYLVQRGYQPLDGRHSPASSSVASHTSESRLLQTDESDVHVNLDSGVELMKRQTMV